MQSDNALGVSLHARWQLAAWCVLVAYSAAHFLYSAVFNAWRTLSGDLLSAFPGPFTLRASHAWPWLTGDWIESEMAWNGGPKILMWNYGPVLHIITLPFALASTYLQAMRLILLVDYGLVAATFALWIHLLFPGRRQPFVWIGILCVWLNYFPLLEALTGREIEIFELFLITVGIWALRQHREIPAGVAFGVAAMTKFLPAVFIPYLFVKGYRRGGWVAALTALSIALIAQPLLGWQWSVTAALANREQTGAAFPTAYANQALTNVLYKTFTIFNINDPRPPTLYPHLLRAIGTDPLWSCSSPRFGSSSDGGVLAFSSWNARSWPS